MLSHWTLDPSLIYVAGAAVLYWAGGVRETRVGGVSFRRAHGKVRRERLLRELSFTAGLLSIVLALCTPIDYYSDELFWLHMGQHIILLTVAPPLILLGKPWPRMWRGISLKTRSVIARELSQSSWASPLRWVTTPIPSFVLFAGNMLAWHIPLFFNLTLAHRWIHDAEHTLFFFTGLLFWAHVVDPGPLHSRLNALWKAAYVLGGMVTGWILAIALVLTPFPLYTHYAHLLYRPEAITALQDQQLAGGMMWVPGSISFMIAVIYLFGRFVMPETPGPRATGKTVATS